MNPSQLVSPRAFRFVVVCLLTAAPLAAVEGGPQPGSQGSPPPRIDSYEPLPAVWGQPITIQGSQLLVRPDPSKPNPGPGGTSSATPVLRMGGAGTQALFTIPASDIESWTSTEIRLHQLSGGLAGDYWIAIYQYGERISNLNRTLHFAEHDPNRTTTLTPLDPSDSSDGPSTVLTKTYPPVEPPSTHQNYIYTYQPDIVGAGDDVVVVGWFGPRGTRRLMIGSGNVPIGIIPPDWIKEWKLSGIRFENRAIPSGVYWVAVFEGTELISNLVGTLRVTEDPSLSSRGVAESLRSVAPGASPQSSRRFELAPTGMRPMEGQPAPTRPGLLQKRPALPAGIQHAPSGKVLQPGTVPSRDQKRAPEKEAPRLKTRLQPTSPPATVAPKAPAKKEASDGALGPVGKEPATQRKMSR